MRAMKNWVVWMAYRSKGIRKRLKSSHPGAVVRGNTLWMPEFVMLKGKWKAREYARTAANAIWPFITKYADQRRRIVILPQGRRPRRDVIGTRRRILG